MPVRIVVIEDHRLFREGLRALLAGVDDVEVVGEVGDLAGLRALDVEADVAVTDLMLPDGADVAVVAAVREQLPGASVLVLSMVDDLETVETVLRAGANGYVLKDAAATELVDAIRMVATQGAYLQPSLGAALAQRRSSGDTGLSPRERDVLRLIALGHTNAEIADLLGLSVRTVETTRAAVGEKVQARSRAQLVRYALDHGLVRSR